MPVHNKDKTKHNNLYYAKLFSTTITMLKTLLVVKCDTSPITVIALSYTVVTN